MRKLTISDAEVMRVALQHEIGRSDESRYDHRLHGVLLVCQGLSCAHVAQWLGQDPRTVQRWVQRFEHQGFAGLRGGDRSGRPRTLDARQWAEVNRALRGPPRRLGYAQNLWDGKLLAHHLAAVHAVTLGVRQCQRLFHALGSRQRKPRPVIARADPAAQAAFKKLRRLARDPDVDLWSGDECRVQQHGTRCVMGVRPRTRIRSCSTRPHARPWPSLARSSSGRAAWCAT